MAPTLEALQAEDAPDIVVIETTPPDPVDDYGELAQDPDPDRFSLAGDGLEDDDFKEVSVATSTEIVRRRAKVLLDDRACRSFIPMRFYRELRNAGFDRPRYKCHPDHSEFEGFQGDVVRPKFYILADLYVHNSGFDHYIRDWPLLVVSQPLPDQMDILMGRDMLRKFYKAPSERVARLSWTYKTRVSAFSVGPPKRRGKRRTIAVRSRAQEVQHQPTDQQSETPTQVSRSVLPILPRRVKTAPPETMLEKVKKKIGINEQQMQELERIATAKLASQARQGTVAPARAQTMPLSSTGHHTDGRT